MPALHHVPSLGGMGVICEQGSPADVFGNPQRQETRDFLARFRSEGAVQVIGCVDGEDRYDGNVAPHGHFICRGCGAVIDLPPIPVDAPDLAQVGRQESYSVTFYGRCNQCLVKEKIS